MASRPGPVRPGRMPTAGPPTAPRPLGLSHLEAQVVQRRLHRVWASLYEPLCLDGASGCRPGRGCPAALRALPQPRYRPEVETIIEVDIAHAVGTMAHGLLAARLREQVPDERLRR